MMKAKIWAHHFWVLVIFGILSFSIVACSDGSGTASTTDDGGGDDGGITSDGGALDLSTDSLNFAQVTLAPAEPALGLGEGLMALVDGDATSLTVTGDAGAVIDIDGNTPDCTGSSVVITEEDATEHEAALNADCSFETTFDSNVGDELTFSLSDGTDQSSYAPISVPAESTAGTDALIDGRAIRTLSGFTAGQEVELCTIGAASYPDEINEDAVVQTCINGDTAGYDCVMVTADENGELDLLLSRGMQYQVLLDDDGVEEYEKCAQIIVATEDEEAAIDTFLDDQQIEGRVMAPSSSRSRVHQEEGQALTDATAFTVNGSMKLRVYNPNTRAIDDGQTTALAFTYEYKLECTGTLNTTLDQLRSQPRNLVMNNSSSTHVQDVFDDENTCSVDEVSTGYDPASDGCQLSVSIKETPIWDDAGNKVIFEKVSVKAEAIGLQNAFISISYSCFNKPQEFLDPGTSISQIGDEVTLGEDGSSALFYASYPSRFLEDVELLESGQTYADEKTSEWDVYVLRLGHVQVSWSLGVQFTAF